MRSVGKIERDVNPAQVYQGLLVSSATSALKRTYDEIDAAVRYVISSTWRESFSRTQLEVVFRRTGLGFVADRLHEGQPWRTPPKSDRGRRIDEIAPWRDRHHQGQTFAILDDTHSPASLMPTVQLPPMQPSNVPAPRHPSEAAPHPFAGRVTLCEVKVGLTGDDLPSIRSALPLPVPTMTASQ